MGSCVSCHRDKDEKRDRKLTKDEIRAIILETEKFNNRVSVSKSIKSDQGPDLITNIGKLVIQEEDDDDDDDYKEEEEEEEKMVNKHDEDPLNDSLMDLNKEFDNFTLDSQEISGENSNKLEHRCPKRKNSMLDELEECISKVRKEDESFINNPLTAEDVIEVLSNTGASSNFSPIPFESPKTILEYQCLSDDSPSVLPDETQVNTKEEEEGKIEIDLTAPTILQTVQYRHRDRSITDPRVVSSSVVEVLNSVPSHYEAIKNRRKSGKFLKSYRKPNQNNPDKILLDSYNLPRERMLAFLFQKNEISQNIIHLMVLNNDIVNIKTVLECLQELQILQKYLDAIDKRLNPPISYAVSQGNVDMVKCLLSYRAIVPNIIYSTFDKGWTPILHVAHRFSFLHDRNKTCFESSLFYILCNYLVNLENQDIIQDFIETKDSDDLTILHQMILQYYPPGISQMSDQVHYPSQLINYVLQLGASMEVKCLCPTQYKLKVDAIGQALFCIHPWYTLELLLTSYQLKKYSIMKQYFINDRSYSILEIVDLRKGIDLSTKQDIKCLIIEYLKN